MDLNTLIQRKQEIETALIQTGNQYQVLVGHKQEVEFQISELSKPEVPELVATDDGVPVEQRFLNGLQTATSWPCPHYYSDCKPFIPNSIRK